MGKKLRSIPLGGLGTGSVVLCNDGRFRNLTINNNRTMGQEIPLAPHSFLAVRGAAKGQTYLRRLQLPCEGHSERHLLPEGALQFRGDYPQADLHVSEEQSPLDITFGAYAPVIPYDYEASALPLIVVAVQLENLTDDSLDVSAVLNWQNTCGEAGEERRASPGPIARHLLIAEEDWEEAKGNMGGDNERRLRASTGKVKQEQERKFIRGEIAPNALRFGEDDDINQNEDGQYCVAVRWHPSARFTSRVWDPECAEESEQFWEQLSRNGEFSSDRAEGPTARCGALCSQLTLGAGERGVVEFVISWYSPRYVMDGVNGGNFYTNGSTDVLAVAQTGFRNRAYYQASVSAWRHRISNGEYPKELARVVVESLGVLSTNTVHNKNGSFGTFQGYGDPRVNTVRDRWFDTFACLMLFPRLESETLERNIMAALLEDEAVFIASEGVGVLGAPEYVGVGAGQVEVGANLVACAYRNYLRSGNLSAISKLAPQIERIMAHLLTQDKDIDGFPDIYQEAPDLDGPFASGLNVITAGLWLVALKCCEVLASTKRMTASAVYGSALKRATDNFERYFWNEEHGYYTLYPREGKTSVEETALNSGCHVGQLMVVWMADVLGFDSLLPPKRIKRVLEALESHNRVPGGLCTLSWPAGGAPEKKYVPPVNSIYSVIPYVCVRIHRETLEGVYTDIAPLLAGSRSGVSGGTGEVNHISQLALWYVLVASRVVAMRLGEKRMLLRPDERHIAASKVHTLLTPRGLGQVRLQLSTEDVFRCEVGFEMDVPVELTSIYLYLDDDPGRIVGTFERDGGQTPLELSVEPNPAGGVVVQIRLGVKTSTTNFELQLKTETPPAEEPGKKQWFPKWGRRDRA